MCNSFTIRWTVKNGEGPVILREYLRRDKKISKAALTDIKFHGGSILVNGEVSTVRKMLHPGDEVCVVFPPEERSIHMESESMPLVVLYEDDHLLIVNKPPGIATIPSRYQNFGSLAQGVIAYYEKKGIPGAFHAVNRLDRDTSGIVLIAKHRFAHSLLAIQQRNGSLKRSYTALVHGLLQPPSGVIDAPIGRNPESIVERMVTENGQRAVTCYQTEAFWEDKQYSKVRLKLETGRTHQIRVHMAYLGHPLLGDDLYGGKREEIERQALHSEEIQFFHPFLEKNMHITAPIPDDIERLT